MAMATILAHEPYFHSKMASYDKKTAKQVHERSCLKIWMVDRQQMEGITIAYTGLLVR